MDPSGYDAGKKIRGTLRHIGVDTLGLMLNLVVHPAAVQDRDGGRRSTSRRQPPSGHSGHGRSKS